MARSATQLRRRSMRCPVCKKRFKVNSRGRPARSSACSRYYPPASSTKAEATRSPSASHRQVSAVPTPNCLAILCKASLSRESRARLAGRGRYPINKQAALGDHAVLGGEAGQHLNHITAGQTDGDPPQLDRFALITDCPSASTLAFINDGIARNRTRGSGFVDLALMR